MRSILLAACLLLPSLPPGAAADPIDDALELLRSSPVFKVRAVAALKLGKQKDEAKRVVAPLVAALSDRHRAVRGAAAIGLGELEDVAALPALSAAMSDDDFDVSELAGRAVKKVVAAFVKSRGRFEDNTYSFTIAGIVADAQFKDHVLEALMKHQNVLVGTDETFDDDEEARGKKKAVPAVELDLSGELVSVSESRGVLELTLSLRSGGYVVKQWKPITASGTSRADVLLRTARQAVDTVLRFLGARS